MASCGTDALSSPQSRSQAPLREVPSLCLVEKSFISEKTERC